MIVDNGENVSISESERGAVTRSARMRFGLWRKRALYSTGAFLLSCALIYPFLDGHWLHSYWESFGKYLILPSLALMLVCLYCTLLLWGAWRVLRDIESERI